MRESENVPIDGTTWVWSICTRSRSTSHTMCGKRGRRDLLASSLGENAKFKQILTFFSFFQNVHVGTILIMLLHPAAGGRCCVVKSFYKLSMFSGWIGAFDPIETFFFHTRAHVPFPSARNLTFFFSSNFLQLFLILKNSHSQWLSSHQRKTQIDAVKQKNEEQ